MDSPKRLEWWIVKLFDPWFSFVPASVFPNLAIVWSILCLLDEINFSLLWSLESVTCSCPPIHFVLITFLLEVFSVALTQEQPFSSNLLDTLVIRTQLSSLPVQTSNCCCRSNQVVVAGCCWRWSDSLLWKSLQWRKRRKKSLVFTF